MKPCIEAFFDDATGTVSYVVFDMAGGHCAVVDAVLDYDAKSGRTSTAGAQRLVEFIQSRHLTLQWILETHAHADHLSAAHYLRSRLGGRIAIAAAIVQVQAVFQALFHLGAEFVPDGRQFDHLLHDNEVFPIGALQARALAVPGHTPACMAFQVDDAVFVGDTLFMPDVGTARCDFPGGDARTLYRSAQRLLSLPPQTRLFMCHDYPPAGRAPAWQTTVAQQKADNIHVRDGIAEDTFVALRTQRDATLDMPALMLPSVQVNIRAGAMPPPEANGVAYLKIPIDAL